LSILAAQKAYYKEDGMYGLVLEGGGCRGSYQAGACKALHEMGIRFSCVAGTSVGALNGAMIAQGDIDRMYDLWHDVNPSKVFRLTDEEKQGLNMPGASRDRIYARLKRIRKIIADRGLDISPLEKMIRENVDEKKLRESPIGFGIVTYDLSGRVPVEIYKEDIPGGQLADYLIASATFPGFKLKNIDGRFYIDGGIYNTLPINLVKDKGCRDIIVIRTFGYGRIRRIDTSGLNITEIKAVESLGPILDFNTERVRKNLKLGYFDAIRAIKGLKGKRYYITNAAGEDFFLDYLASLNDEKITRIAELFGIERKPGKRLLFEVILPRLAEILNIPDNATYEELSIELLEMIAESVNLERFKIYDIKEFIAGIFERRDRVPNDSEIERTVLFRRFDFISRTARNKIVTRLAHEIFDGLMKSVER
jgi:NTE family protein